MSKYILRNGFPGLFVLAEWGRKGEMTINDAFDKKQVPLYFMRFRFHTLGQVLRPEDVMNPHLPEAEPPEVSIFAGFKYEGRGNNPLRAATSNGRDIAAWSYFLNLFRLTGADEATEGPAVPKDKDKGLTCIAFRVGALEGSGNFEAKNVLRAHAPSLDKFTAEDKAAAASFAQSLGSDAPAAGSGLSLASSAAPATPAGPMMSLGGTPATAPAQPATPPATSAEGNGTPATATPRKRRTKAEIEADKAKAETERLRIEAEEREAVADEERERAASGGA